MPRVSGHCYAAPAYPTALTAESDLIASIAEIVERACAADSNVFGYGIWTHHITAVVENARRLAPTFDADTEIVVLAALLHDYASVKDEALYADHHLHGPIEAERVLNRLNYPSDRIEEVMHAIAAHRGSVEVEAKTPEAVCLRNADALAHVQNVPSLLKLAYAEHKMNVDDGAQWVRAKLERSWEKLSPDVRALAQTDFDAARTLLPNGAA